MQLNGPSLRSFWSRSKFYKISTWVFIYCLIRFVTMVTRRKRSDQKLPTLWSQRSSVRMKWLLNRFVVCMHQVMMMRMCVFKGDTIDSSSFVYFLMSGIVSVIVVSCPVFVLVRVHLLRLGRPSGEENGAGQLFRRVGLAFRKTASGDYHGGIEGRDGWR